MKMNKNCENCGESVSNDFARVFGNNNGEVKHCFNCINEHGKDYMFKGAGANEDLEHIKPTFRL